MSTHTNQRPPLPAPLLNDKAGEIVALGRRSPPVAAAQTPDHASPHKASTGPGARSALLAAAACALTIGALSAASSRGAPTTRPMLDGAQVVVALNQASSVTRTALHTAAAQQRAADRRRQRRADLRAAGRRRAAQHRRRATQQQTTPRRAAKRTAVQPPAPAQPTAPQPPAPGPAAAPRAEEFAF